jgi:hypothetical protein
VADKAVSVLFMEGVGTMKRWTNCGVVFLAVLCLTLLSGPAVAMAQQPEFPLDPEDAGAAAGAGACACGGVAIFIMLAVAVVWIFVLVWVYRDATARGMENAVIWVLLTFFLGLIGLVVYLIVRPAMPQREE